MKKIPWYRSISVRLPLIVALCCIIPAFIFSYYNNKQTRQKVLESARSTIYANLYDSSLLLEGVMSGVEDFGKDICTEDELVDYIRLYMVGKERRGWARSNISLLFSQSLSDFRTLSAIYLFWENGEQILSTDLNEKEIPTDSGWGAQAQDVFDRQAAGKIAWRYFPEEAGHGGLCYVRPVELGSQYGKCALVCEVGASTWGTLLRTTYEGSHLYVCDYSGNVLLQKGGLRLETVREEALFEDAFENRDNFGTYESRGEDGNYLVMYYNSVENGWKYLARVPMEEIFFEVGNQMRTSYIMIGVGLLSALVAAVFLTRTVVRPLQVLFLHMEKVESGELVPIENIRRQDETGAILAEYTHMVQELKRMIDEVYVQQLLRKQAQLSSLQSQMDEHFLYNTLNMIYCEACREQADTSARMLLILSRYFRLSLAEGRDKAPLNEIEQLIRYYLAIQKARFGEGLVCRVETFPGMENYVALKYLFQPIVENAIVHGFEKKLGDHVISIIMRKESDQGREMLYFAVEDDGAGIPEPQLEQLISEMGTFEKVEGSGYALKNIREQIRITYGEGYPIQIESRRGEGTKVSFRIPLEKRPA